MLALGETLLGFVGTSTLPVALLCVLLPASYSGRTPLL
jgi:hypothetical protein